MRKARGIRPANRALHVLLLGILCLCRIWRRISATRNTVRVFQVVTTLRANSIIISTSLEHSMARSRRWLWLSIAATFSTMAFKVVRSDMEAVSIFHPSP